MSDLYQSEQGCMWPHRVDSPIYVFDRDSFEKYESGEYKPPDHCVCGAKMEYVPPVTVVLVQHGRMTGEMILTLEVPLLFVKVDLTLEGDDQ